MNDITIDKSFEQKQIRLQQLREELDRMGYHVVKKDWVRKFGELTEVSDRDRHQGYWEQIRPRIIERMGAGLGVGILRSGAVKVSEENSVNLGYTLRAEVSIILRDPQFDKPEWLR